MARDQSQAWNLSSDSKAAVLNQQWPRHPVLTTMPHWQPGLAAELSWHLLHLATHCVSRRQRIQSGGDVPVKWAQAQVSYGKKRTQKKGLSVYKKQSELQGLEDEKRNNNTHNNSILVSANPKWRSVYPPANVEDARDAGSIGRSRRSPGVGNSNPLQYSSLENSTDRGA